MHKNKSKAKNVKSFTPCEYARQRHQSLLRWRHFWTRLLFAFGAAIILFYIGAILLFIREIWLTFALSTLGTIVGGVGIKWVLKRRNEAVREEEKAYLDVAQYY
jgi:hypothetical protein